MTTPDTEPSVVRPAPAAPPPTGDAGVDAALDRLHEAAQGGSLDAQAEAGEAAHRTLQGRLADLGGD